MQQLSKISKILSKVSTNPSGFTLVELIVVIGILGILAIGLIADINPVNQIKAANDAHVKDAVTEISKAVQSYALSHDGHYPQDLATLVASGDLKSIPTPPQGYPPYSFTPNPPGCTNTGPIFCTSVSVYANLFSQQYLTTPYFFYDSNTGNVCTTDSTSSTNCVVASNTSGIANTPTPSPTNSPAATPTDTPTPTLPQTPNNFPHVAGNNIVDPSGNTLVLHGTQIPSTLNSGNWNNGTTVTQLLNPSTFAAINSWHMNVIRIPVAAYRYQLANYMTLLDQIVSQANQAGLYVVLANFEDSRAGMGTVGSGLLDSTGLSFWQFIASHYASNTMVMYDLINEPQNASYSDWLSGNGSGVIGMQQAVNAIRTAGGKQIIIAESIDTGSTYFNGFSSFINDPNIVYSIHNYFKYASMRTTAGWDSAFGNLSASNPVYIGEWAFLPNANYPSFCSGLNETSGATLTNNFLSYLKSHNISWSVWAFNQYHQVSDTISFSPTTLNGFNQNLSCCGAGPSTSCNFGIGQLIQQFTTSNY